MCNLDVSLLLNKTFFFLMQLLFDWILIVRYYEKVPPAPPFLFYPLFFLGIKMV